MVKPKRTDAEPAEKSTSNPVELETSQDENESDDENSEESHQGGQKYGSDYKRDEDSESEEEEDVAAIFKGVDVSEIDEDENIDEKYGSDDGGATAKLSIHTIKNTKHSEQCTFDLRNMVAVNTHQIKASSLYSSSKKKQSEVDKKSLTIPLDQGHGFDLNEKFLLDCAGSNCSQLVQALWQLPTERSDAGPLVSLPGYDEIRLPRALPPPPPREETKWEKFAKAKGIPLNKEKRSRKVWDEATGTWMYRHGYEKANSKSKEWPIMEVGANENPYDDPWEKLRDEKRSHVEKNNINRMKNQEQAGNLMKGTTNRVTKDLERNRKIGKAGSSKHKDKIPPSGVPVDLPNASTESKKRGKDNTVAALKAVQRSTASLGKFDPMREGEPEKRKTLEKLKKRKFESATDKKVLSSEGEKSMKILKTVMNGGGSSKERDIRKGKLAKGETAYDYDYDDGLGASSFKKKKGRAGAGKMKKMTKKRAQ